MATIDGGKPVGKLDPAYQVSKRSKAGIGQFDKMLQAAVASPAERPSAPQPTATIGTIRPAQFDAEPGVLTDRVVGRVTRLIDTLDCYRQKLSQKAFSLRDLQTLVADMQTHSESLQTLSGEVDKGDDLRAIVDQSLMLSSVEIARFKAGHYNTSS